MIPPDDSDLLRNFLFHLRTPLSSVKGASQLAKQWSGKIPISVLNWLEKWKPAVERWISAEESAHSYLRDEYQHDWKRIINEMAEDMQDVSTAFAEGKTLEIPESPECNMIIELALDGGFKYLNSVIQPILRKDYQHLLQ